MDLVPSLGRHTEAIVGKFIQERVNESGAEGVVIGVSGGLDSAVILQLAASTLGPERVSGLFLPFGDQGDMDEEYAWKASKNAGIKLTTLDISSMVGSIPVEMEGMTLGNAKARARMLILYANANKYDRLVIGTSNKTELLLGYFTKYGDGAADIYPIGDLFKTQVRTLARQIGVPEEIVDRPPSAGLIKGQTDEGEIGLPYPVIDQILVGYLRSLNAGEILDRLDMSIVDLDEMDRSGLDHPLELSHVLGIFDMVASTKHKRCSLAIPKVGGSTVALDFRERW